jgi:hypothetical protein
VTTLYDTGTQPDGGDRINLWASDNIFLQLVALQWKPNLEIAKQAMNTTDNSPMDVALSSASDCNKATIEALFQNYLDAKGQNVPHWEAEIDQIVARLYGLTDAEWVMIEGRTSLI